LVGSCTSANTSGSMTRGVAIWLAGAGVALGFVMTLFVMV
jgi:hypothetical protein